MFLGRAESRFFGRDPLPGNRVGIANLKDTNWAPQPSWNVIRDPKCGIT